MIRPSKKKGNKAEIVAVGTNDTGFFYFQKLGYLKAGELLEVAKYESDKKKGNSLIGSLINKIAKDKAIEATEAAKYIFPTKMADGTEVYPPDHDAVLAQYPDEIQELSRFSIPTMQIHNFIANLLLSGFHTEDNDFVPGRIAFQVEATEDISINATSAVFEAVPFLLPDGAAIKFGDIVLKVDGNWDIDSETVQIKPSPGNVSAGTTGFLYDITAKKYILGNEGWGINDTMQLPQSLIDEIYNFYRTEGGFITEDKAEDASLGETQDATVETPVIAPAPDQAPIKATETTPDLQVVPSPISTGANSTSESNVIAFPIPDSPGGEVS
ncbi:MAG: hypothetical protein V7L23_15275 [Nostoc sp.]|uniref:hypothetical protein n=1 Tax=Nostoc sp. TaxID=1180 RepID=UPI002FF387FD